MTQIDMARWAEIADKPLPKGVGDLDAGLCTMARIGYAATGKITDAPECVPASIRAFLIALNDAIWAAEFRQQLGPLEIAQRVLAADPAAETKRGLMLADWAVRVIASRALRAAGFVEEADKLTALPAVIDHNTALAAAARAAIAQEKAA